MSVIGNQAAVAAVRGTWDSLSTASLNDLRNVRDLLEDMDEAELRAAVSHLARMFVSIMVLLTETIGDFDVDDCSHPSVSRRHDRQRMTPDSRLSAAERAVWLADYEAGRHRLPVEKRPHRAKEGGTAPTVIGRRRWNPTLAECRYLPTSDVRNIWTRTVRAAAKAQYPIQTVELRHAAYLARYLVDADRLDEDRAKVHLQAAAKAAGLRPGEADRAIKDGWLLAGIHSIEEHVNGGVKDHPPGAFSAVASARTTYDHDNGFAIDPEALLPLPTAVLVHRSHDARQTPVGVGVPTWRDGAIHLDAVFASHSPNTRTGDTWSLVRTGRLRSVSVWARCEEFHRGPDGRLVKGTLVAVDLVRTPADDGAAITDVVLAPDLTPAQRETQRNLDRYVANPKNPTGLDFFALAERHGAGAMDLLAPVVAPLLEERARMRPTVGGWR